MKKLLVLAIGAILALAPTAHAQQITGGNVYGTVTDESGAVLPAVNVTLTGEVGTKSTTTDPQGHFRFINALKGDYALALGLSGLVRKPSIPAARAAASSAPLARPDTPTIGMRPTAPPRARMRRVASRPSIPGSITSISTTS